MLQLAGVLLQPIIGRLRERDVTHVAFQTMEYEAQSQSMAY
jgi:hypothetical protein